MNKTLMVPLINRQKTHKLAVKVVNEYLSANNTDEIYFFHPLLEYLVFSNKGNVKNIITGKILKQYINKSGYKTIYTFCPIKGKRKCFMVHRLCSEAMNCWYGINNYQYEINHIDGNKLNNNIQNLEWLTRKENLQHAIDNKLYPSRPGDLSPSRKIMSKQRKDIAELYTFGYSVKDLSNAYKVTETTIYAILKEYK